MAALVISAERTVFLAGQSGSKARDLQQTGVERQDVTRECAEKRTKSQEITFWNELHLTGNPVNVMMG